MSGIFSETVVRFMGSPPGSVLPPLLVIMWRDSCRSCKEGSYLVKFSDDTALSSLLQGPQHHSCALPAFVKCCNDQLILVRTLSQSANVVRKHWHDYCVAGREFPCFENGFKHSYFGSLVHSFIQSLWPSLDLLVSLTHWCGPEKAWATSVPRLLG